MKKLFSLIASLVIVLGLSGCGLEETTGVTLEELEINSEIVEVLDLDEAFYFTKIGAISKSLFDETYEVGDNITLNNYEVSGRTYVDKEDDNGKIKSYPVVKSANQDYVNLPTSDMKFKKNNSERIQLKFMFRTNIGDFYKGDDGNAYFTKDKFFNGYLDTFYSIEENNFKKPTAYVMINGYQIEYAYVSGAIAVTVLE